MKLIPIHIKHIKHIKHIRHMGHIRRLDMFHMLHMPDMSNVYSPVFNDPLTALRNNYLVEGSKHKKGLTKLWVRTIVIKPIIYIVPAKERRFR